MTTGRSNAAFFGTQTSALAVSGNQSPGPSTKVNVFAYDGTDWTVSASVNTAKKLLEVLELQQVL